MDSLINIGLFLAYFLIGIAILGAVIFPLAQIFGNLKNAKNGLIGFAMLIAVLVIAYAVSPAETGAFYDKKGISPGLSKLIGGGLLATYIFTFGVVGSIIYSEIAKWFK